MEKTRKSYLDDSYCFEMDARVLAIHGNAAALDRTCFYPGGGGQPPDQGELRVNELQSYQVLSLQEDSEQVIWHGITPFPQEDLAGLSVHLSVDKMRRLAFMRHHTALHILNTVALRDYQAWITGVQIGTEISRIDFKLENFSATVCADLEEKVNKVISEDHPVNSYSISEGEFRQRDDLIRTLVVKPPIKNGLMRVVEITGFDAQACGGTHVHTTAELGRFSIVRTENKGRINKRFYVRLD
jgi:misacylated tRNA(Ala) deacylase